MKRTDIDKRFTQEVVSYIAMGYTIHTNSMSGSQGETAKVDLVKGNDRIRIYLEDCGSDYDLGYNVTTMVVGRVPEREWERTIWNDHLEVILTEKWYEISRRRNYYATRKEAEAASAKRYARWERHYVNPRTADFNLEKAARIVKSFVNRQKGCKSAKLANIKRVYKVISSEGKATYHVDTRNHRFTLA